MNPNSNINLTLESYHEPEEGVTCEIKYKDKQDRYPDEIKTVQLSLTAYGSSSRYEAVIDNVSQIYLQVEINHISNTSYIGIGGWQSYESEQDFDRFMIVAISVDW